MPTTPGTTNDPVPGRPAPPDEVLTVLQRWAPEQRWFPAKGSTEVVDRVAVIDLRDPLDEATVTVHLLALPHGGVLQVPLVLRPDDGTWRTGVIATLHAEAGDRLLVDGCHDPAFVRAWLAAAEHDLPVEPDLHDMRVLTGEQSNTSVLLPSAVPPAILKVFRGVSSGPNPDVEVPLALSRVGWRGVPRPLAWLTGSWPGADGVQVGHLGVLSELVVGAEDGFELACRYAGEATDFRDLATDLGRTTAQMHSALRAALPLAQHEIPTQRHRTPPGPPAEGEGPDVASELEGAGVAGVVTALRQRAASAAAGAPVLQARAAEIAEVLTAVEDVGALPPLQRVHGDYHLGQVLRSGQRGWVVLDFEGEPQAPAEERTRPDLALRDLAGMLRSIDYAAAVGGATSPDWARGARQGLVDGYHAEAEEGTSGLLEPPGTPGTVEVLLRALELDKALYEVVYESRNRPTWVHIPLDAVDRLLGRR